MSSSLAARPAARTRLAHLDAIRGLAVLLMMGDHTALLIPHGQAYRLTLGRIAMPLFFVLAGALVTRLRRRHVEVAAVGVLLPVLVPWVDNPNVLVWWAAGCVMLVGCRWAGVSPWLLVVVGLAMGANGFGDHHGTYEPTALLGLMAVGALIGRDGLGWGRRLPAWLGWLGRYPITVYVGHLLVIEALVRAGVR